MMYLQIYLLIWLWSQFEPIQEGLDKLFNYLPKNILTNNVYIALGCMKCLNLWITLIITQSLFIALIMSLIAQIHTKIIE